jgi:hypothetical protein
METIREILGPDFLLRNSVYMSLLVGLACPLVGVYLVLRRLVFMGVALPQISSCGIAFAFALHAWGLVPHFEGGEHTLAFAGSVSLPFPRSWCCQSWSGEAAASLKEQLEWRMSLPEPGQFCCW